MQKNESVIIRDAVLEDKSFIFATFLRGLYYGESWFSLIPKQTFMAQYHKVLESLLSLPTVYVKVACLKDDPEVILGYSILGGSGANLHFIFVKKPWRSIGLARNLTPLTVTTVTHLTSTGLALLRKHPQIVFNPFALE